MADKGKGKESDPISFDGGSDSDDDFFVSKRKPTVREITPPRSSSPPTRAHSNSDSEEDASPGSKRKKKKVRRAAPKKPTLDLPAWTRHGSNEHKKSGSRSRSRKGSSQIRGSTEERAETIVIDDSDDEPGPSTSKAPKKSVRKRVQLTPPPEMSEQKKAEIERLVREHISEKFSEQASVEDQASSPEKDKDVERVHITIRMQAPPEKKESAAPAAIKEYQKARTLILSRTGPIATGITILSERIQKRPEDIILVYNDNRVYPRSTPAQLGILDKADMTGYEKEYWLKLEADKRRALEEDLSFTADNTPGDQNDADDDVLPLDPTPSLSNGNGNTTQSSAPSSLPPTQTQADLIRFKISSSFGEERMKGPRTLKLSAVIKFYLKKIGKSVDEVDRWYIMFDGEKLDKGMRIQDTEVEDGDMLEVGCK
ncbi:hypothetical protein I302_105785 [Kwoniella bestiolae CBS 10118]|uniref:Rad60/SUMO-like domain-containing protein n=1 Tax=Kwoniella bestiolae CBS 10118 TaxID=1296100 RepID=A0A1B9G249_9TREE|nr:hypothetical protein I302_04906 [Kwoniella bestiolae CBS 10118]OCF25096.1 hypothetical protein I302_04906 [Kwoniella bestiolae CBS 10118]